MFLPEDQKQRKKGNALEEILSVGPQVSIVTSDLFFEFKKETQVIVVIITLFVKGRNYIKKPVSNTNIYLKS